MTEYLTNIVKRDLENIFSITELGKLIFYLGLNISQTDNGKIKLSQKTFIFGLLKKFGMDMCKTIDTPSNMKKLGSGTGHKVILKEETHICHIYLFYFRADLVA